MNRFIIERSGPLKGNVRILGSKNAILPIMAASILADSNCIINEAPALSDVIIMQNLIENLGAKIKFDDKKSQINIDSRFISNSEVLYEICAKMRASFLLAGPLLAKMGEFKIALPGGCAIGSRPIDLHLKGLAALGAEIIQENGYIKAFAKKLYGANIYLDFPSVGATENIMMAAVLAEGQTIIQNCAVEPEIVDLSNFLSSMGAIIRGSGTDTIKITGVNNLKGCEHSIIPDRIEAGTFMIAAAITGGDITLENIVIDHLKPVIAKLGEANIIIENKDSLRIYAKEKLLPIDIKTLPYPGFPTDMQAQFSSLLSVIEGTSIITETIFENRFMHMAELSRMGADIKIDSRTAIIEGVNELAGATVKATDLRAGAALVLAGLKAKDRTIITDIEHIERGYYKLDEKLKSLGANIYKE